MPSKTPAQARLMAGIAHGWKPSGLKHAPSRAVATEFNQADKGSKLLSRAMKHASGGAVSPLGTLTGNPMKNPMTMRSPSPKFGIGVGTAKMRMPRVPIAATMRNVDQSVKGARVALPKIAKAVGGRAKRFQEGGPVGLGIRAIAVLKNALSHLANKDISSAAATLRSSPEAMRNPAVAQAMQGLRTSSGIAPATKSLTDLVNAHTDTAQMPTFKKGSRVKKH